MIDASLIFDGTLATTGTGVPTGAAITATRVSTNVIDMLSARDVGVGDELELHVNVTVAFVEADTNSATLQVQFETCATAGGSYDVILLSPAYTTASLVIGAKIFRYKLPILDQRKATGPQEFLRLTYTVGGSGSYSAGKVFSYITGAGDRQVFRPYGPNYTVGA